MAEKVTIATVAEHANVSRQTVSNVINSPHIVREETRRRVEEAIAALGYRANQAARQMRTGRSRLLAVRIEPTRDGINGSVLDRFLHGLTFAAAAPDPSGPSPPAPVGTDGVTSPLRIEASMRAARSRWRTASPAAPRSI